MPDSLFDLISTRSFSSLWYWLLVGIFWTILSHWVLGASADLLRRAQRAGPEAQAELAHVLRLYAQRMVFLNDSTGLFGHAVLWFLLAGLLTLGFVYGVEWAQALAFLAVPGLGVSVLRLRMARRIIAENAPDDATLFRMIGRHRLIVQALALVMIFLTSFWGMYIVFLQFQMPI